MHNIIHYSGPYQCYVGLTILSEIFSTFSLNVENILQNIVDPIEHCYASE